MRYFQIDGTQWRPTPGPYPVALLPLKDIVMAFAKRARIHFQRRNLCTGCLSCMTVCCLQREGLQSLQLSRIRIELDLFGGNNVMRICQQCEKPRCLEACPRDVFEKDDQTGVVSMHMELCHGCKRCIEACPFDAIFWNDEAGSVIKCDTCQGKPMCVEACRFGVLTYE